MTFEFRTEPGETVEKIEELAAGALYRVWSKTGACVLEFTSILLRFEVTPQPAVGDTEVAPFFDLTFENGLVLRSRTGWGVNFYRKREVKS